MSSRPKKRAAGSALQSTDTAAPSTQSTKVAAGATKVLYFSTSTANCL